MFVPCCSPKHCVHSEGKGSSIEMKGERSGSESNSERNHRPLPPPSPLPQPPSKTKSLRQNKNQEGLQDRQLQEQEIVASRSTSESHYTHYSPLSQPRPESSPQHYIPHNQMRVQDLQQQLQQHHQQILLHRSQQRAVQHENRAVEQEENYCDSNSNHTSLDGSSTHGRCSSNGSGSNPFLNNNNNNNNNTSSSSNNNNNSNSNSERTTPKERFYEEKTLQTNEEDEEILVRVCEASGVSLRILKGGGGGGPSCYDHRPRNVSLSRCGIHTRPLSDELNYDDCGVMTHLSASESPQNLEDLAKEVQSLREENKRNHRELDRWKSNCRKYKASYLIVADHNRVLVRENSTQKWEVAYLQQRLQRQQERYDELERNYDILQDNYKTLSGLFNRLPPPDKRLEEKYEMLREDYEKISSERINLMDKVSQLTEQLACYLSETVSEDVLGGGGGGGTNGNGGGGRGGGGSGSGGSGGGPGGGAVGNEPADGVIWTDNHHNSHHHHQQQQQQQHQHHHQQQQQHHQHHHNQLHQQQQQQLQQQSPQQHNQQQHNPQHSQKQQLQEKEQQQQHQLHPPQHHHHHHRQPHHPHHHSREMLNDGLTDEKTPPSSTGHSKERYATGQKKNKPQPYAIRELGHYARLPPGSDGDDEDSYSNFPCSDVTVDGDSRTEIFRAGPGGHNKSNMTLGSKSSKPFIRHRKTKHRLPSVPAWLFQLKNNKVHPGDDDD